jgi:phospholipid/cholesterol/gamma-HCH transport system ATP-binding protein
VVVLSESSRIWATSRSKELAPLKLALVGRKGFRDFYRNEISGGTQKRAGPARAMALDPEIQFFDEPSAGLDSITSYLLNEPIPAAQDWGPP